MSKPELIYANSIRVFYSTDCQKYGVQIFDRGTSSGKLGWRQIDPHPKQPNRSAYTPYKKVAERWMSQFIARGKAVQ